jgi:hypothetical protein
MVALYQRQVIGFSRPGPGHGPRTISVALVVLAPRRANHASALRPSALRPGAPRPRGPPTLRRAHMTLGWRQPAQVFTKIHPSGIKRTD